MARPVLGPDSLPRRFPQQVSVARVANRALEPFRIYPPNQASYLCDSKKQRVEEVDVAIIAKCDLSVDLLNRVV